jgi:hypothetical protein
MKEVSHTPSVALRGEGFQPSIKGLKAEYARLRKGTAEMRLMDGQCDVVSRKY